MAKSEYALLVAMYLLGLLLAVTVLLPPTEAAALIDASSRAGTFDLTSLVETGDYIDCKDTAIRFDEPCRCYRLQKNATTGPYLLDCDEVAFQFFPPMPSNVSLFMASFRNVGYQGLPTELFRGRSLQLRALDLSNNYLLSITTSSLSGLENSLEFLNLSHNSLGKNFQPILDIPEIHRLRALTVLDLSFNEIKLFSEQFFSGLTDTLEELYLSGNDLTNVQFLNSAQNLFRLRIVDISDNRIFRLETFGFGALSNLQFLSIENNFLSMMLPSAFNGTALKVLNLRRNRLQAVDSVVFGGVEGSLTAVDLSYNVLRRVHDFRKFSALEKMNLSSNTIIDFANFLALPTSLQSLDLSGNHLSARSIPYISSFPSLRRLSLARNFLGNFFQGTNIASTFSFALLEDLDLRSVNLTSMPTALFPLLPRLRSLDLSYNILPQLTEKSFLNASLLLENLTLSHCRLKSVEGYTWLNLPNLLSLDLSNNVLSNGTDIMDFPKSLRKLKVAKNRLTTLPDLQVAVPNLVWLDASENLLTGVNFNSLPIGSLRHLDLNGNILTAIPNFSSTNNETGHSSDFLGALGWIMQTGRNVNRTSVLEMLDVSWNRIERIERLSVDLQNITELNLSGNKIEVLPERFLENLKRLEKVNLSRNLLTGLENQTFIKLPQLKTLDLSYNKLKVFPSAAFNQVPFLQTLLLNSNSLIALEPENCLAEFPIIRTLSVAGNELNQISFRTFNGTSIRHLDLSKNHLKALTNVSFGLMPRLRTLNLSENNLTQVTAGAFWFMIQLQHLDLSKNFLRKIPEDVLRGIRRLALDLSENRLEGVPLDIFAKSRVDRLEKLNLANNRLTIFPDKTLSEQDYNLITLNLAGNDICEVPAGSLISTKNVDLSFNPLSDQAIQTVLSDPKTTFSLNLAGVGMSRFPSLQLQFLTHLNLSSNKLSSFGDPLNWERATLLESLDLSHNQLRDLRDSKLVWVLPKLAFLKWLDLSGNLIKVIRENELSGLINVDYLDLSNLPNLETFDISNLLEFPRLCTLNAANYPRLANFPLGDISLQLPALRYLALELKYPIVTSQLQGMLTPSLHTLRLTGPIVTRITRDTFGAFSPADEFQLSLENLAINSLPADIFQRFPRAAHLDLQVRKTRLGGSDIAGLMQNLNALDNAQFSFVENRVECTCNESSVMSVWMTVKGSIGEILCDSPLEMAGQSVLELDLTDLPCQRSADEIAGSLQLPPSRGNSLKRLPQFSQLNQAFFDEQTIPTTEADIIFEISSTKASTAQLSQSQASSFHLEGAIAGIVVGLLVLTAIMITAIVLWFRREKTRHSSPKTTAKSIPGDHDAPYAVIPNTDVVAHPTWYPPPQPVLILPARNKDGTETGFVSPDYPIFDERHYFERALYDVPFHESRSENTSRVVDGDFSDYARTSYAGKSIPEEDKDNQSDYSFAADSCDMTFTFDSVFTPSSINGDDGKSQIKLQ